MKNKVASYQQTSKADFGDFEYLNEPSLYVDFVLVSHFEADWNRINIQTGLIGSFMYSQSPKSALRFADDV